MIPAATSAPMEARRLCDRLSYAVFGCQVTRARQQSVYRANKLTYADALFCIA